MKAKLKETSNLKMQRLVGMEGDLLIGNDGRFHFHFIDSDNKQKDLSSKIVSQLGDLDHPASKEVFFQTKNSTYLFEKKENVESLYGWEN